MYKRQLWDGALIVPIRFNEFGNTMTANTTRTGTRADNSIGPTCLDWTSAATTEFSVVAQANLADAGWTESNDDRCSKNFHMYCVRL